METHEHGDTSVYSIRHPILNFNRNHSGFFQITGNSTKNSFRYFLEGDSLKIVTENLDTTRAEVTFLGAQRLTLTYGELRIIHFIPLPVTPKNIQLEKLKQLLTGQVWVLNNKRYDDAWLKFHFDTILRDSSLIRPKFHNLIKSVRIHPHYFQPSEYDDHSFWSVGDHNNTVILRVESIYSSIPEIETMIVKSISNDQIDLYSWHAGKKTEFSLKKVIRPEETELSRQIELLTQSMWRIENEHLPPPPDTTGLMDLGDINDDFEELKEFDYHYDSTLLVSQSDIDDRKLILDFLDSGTYRIYRDERLLDEGKWTPKFYNQVIQLQSHRKVNSDGIVGGFIEIQNLTKKRLKLVRFFYSRKDAFVDSKYSYPETYKPAKRR